MQNWIHILLFIVTAQAAQNLNVISPEKQHMWNKAYESSVLAENYILTASTPTTQVCSFTCSGTPGCRSFVFHPISASCRLYDHLVEYTGVGAAAPGTLCFWLLSPRCPTALGYTQEAGVCFKIYGIPMPRETAAQTCRQDGGHLFVADSAGKLAMLRSKVNDSAWLGASDVEVEGDWWWVDGRRLVVGSPLWQSQQPDNYLGQHFSALALDGTIDDDNATSARLPVCQLPVSPSV